MTVRTQNKMWGFVTYLLALAGMILTMYVANSQMQHSDVQEIRALIQANAKALNIHVADDAVHTTEREQADIVYEIRQLRIATTKTNDLIMRLHGEK